MEIRTAMSRFRPVVTWDASLENHRNENNSHAPRRTYQPSYVTPGPIRPSGHTDHNNEGDEVSSAIGNPERPVWSANGRTLDNMSSSRIHPRPAPGTFIATIANESRFRFPPAPVRRFPPFFKHLGLRTGVASVHWTHNLHDRLNVHHKGSQAQNTPMPARHKRKDQIRA